MKAFRVELFFVAALTAIAVALSTMFHLPFVAPTAGGAAFIGVHYLLPLLSLVVWCIVCGICQREQRRGYVVAFLAYAVTMWLHFNIKMWAPFINPRSYDALFWSWDRQLHPVVDAAKAVRLSLTPLIERDSNLYMNSFIMLFYSSFIVHALKTPAAFRPLFLAAMFFQGLGALAYLAFPAVGPFIFETGVNPVVTHAQQTMMTIHDTALAGGTDWLVRHGSAALLAGLGAMPSLHAGGAFLFLWFAWRYCRALLPVYIPLFAFIIVSAVANRFHYLVDLPAGIALAMLSIWLAHRAVGTTTARAPAQPDLALPEFAPA